MKNKALLIVLAALLSLTSCGSKEESSSSKNESSQSAAETTAEETTAEETTAESTESSEAASEAETTESTDKDTEALLSEPVDFKLVDGLSENYADLEKRCFAYDGKIYTLGETTLQELIDAGLPFNENELNNKDNNVNKNYSTPSYTVKINDYVTIQLEFMNTTDAPLTEKECLLSQVRWYTLYVPHAEYDDSDKTLNAKIVENLNDAASHLCFSFPFDLKKDQLLEKNPDATDIDDYNHVEYKVESTVYMGKSGYKFGFNKDTNQLEEVYISWLP